MPLPCTLTPANYRCFSQPAELALRPLTLLYGWNSVGKSALLRLLPIIADSARPDAGAALDLSGEAGQRSSFQDVKWKGPIEESDPEQMRLAVGFAWSAPAPLERLVLRFDLVDEPESIVIKSFDVRPRCGPSVAAALVGRAEDPASQLLIYDIMREGSPEERIALRFNGLVPEATDALPVTREMRELLSELPSAIQWLKTGRRAPGVRTPRAGSVPQQLGPDGSGVAEILRGDLEIRRSVSAWFEKHFGRRLDVEEALPSDFRVVFRTLRRAGIVVDVMHSGEGMAQVLPVLTAAELARRNAGAGRPRILAVEEPEAGLHPNAQRWLAEHLATMAAAPSPPTLVLETHAYAMLLTIQLLVASGELPHDRVLIYWVRPLADGSSEACRVELDELGRPSGDWPEDVFADQRTLAYELRRKQLERGSET